MILWLNPFSGLSGDMLLGALLGVGAPLDAVRASVASTGITGWRLDAGTERRGALAATRAVVTTDDTAKERRAAELLDLVGRARPEPVAALATRAITALAEVEAGLHGVPVADVHLHEIGGVDTVVDTVGVAAALHELGVAEVHCGPLAMGEGTVRTRHGVLPLPAPATAALIARMAAPIVPAGVAGETVTPTGAALLLAAGARFGPAPAMSVRAVGYGAGAKEFPGRANVLQALLGESAHRASTTTMVLLETNVDDVTGELLGHLVGRLLAEGAADAWVSPVTMKKGRPAHTVHVLADPAGADGCERLLLAETGSLGVRRQRVERHALPRRVRTVELAGRPIRVKYGPWGGKPEHDDVAAAAEAVGLPLREVARRALALADSLADSPGDDLDLR
ncbi:nickel pincer cofactor biosynthesis protein LarC [Pseudonocardia eucalypti]|uniref:Pyridinium-3,5-bisthiocarboxylic acid mononucleotide nickel insertion protein n=1 Tax=Pseudonocardia eucalypti TaxID=648755 RepID=A0ABP9QM81_9PSEU|nr:uncharacterized protein (TIGR00299 family) protein [Pseudonocardia eucalypti]